MVSSHRYIRNPWWIKFWSLPNTLISLVSDDRVTRAMAEDALQIRRTAKTKFTRKKNELYSALAKKQGADAVQAKVKELTDAWFTVEGKHDLYLLKLSDEEAQAREEPWINELEEIYSEASVIYEKYASENKRKLEEEEMRRKFDTLTKRRLH